MIDWTNVFASFSIKVQTQHGMCGANEVLYKIFFKLILLIISKLKIKQKNCHYNAKLGFFGSCSYSI